MNKANICSVAIIGILLSTSSCGLKDEYQGSAIVGVTTQALSVNDIAKVSITVTSNATPAHFGPAIVYDLVKNSGGKWTGLISDIPVGDCDFAARAYNASGVEIYGGTSTKVSITKGSPVAVALVLHQKVAGTTFTNSAPQITGLVASATQVASGEAVTLTATASDPDSDPVEYSWSAGCGTFASSAYSASGAGAWTAPATAPTAGECTLTVTARDGKGGQAQLAIKIKVGTAYGKGSADISLTFNHSPVITEIKANNGHLAPGASTTLSATATDPENDSVGYIWTDDCSGGFSGANGNFINPTTWRAPSPAPTNSTCKILVMASDSKALVSTGTLTITVGNLATPSLAPVVLSSFQSQGTVPIGTKIKFAVEAKDPEGTTLTITWSAATGALGTATDSNSGGIYKSEVEWTTPVVSKDHQVKATIKDASGVETVKVFSVALTGYYTLTSKISKPMYALNSIWVHNSGTGWAVGGNGIIKKLTAGKWAMDNSGSSHSYELYAVWGSSTSDVWAVGKWGDILKRVNGAWTKENSSTTQTIRDLWGSSSTDIWAVGYAGLVLHRSGGSWSQVTRFTNFVFEGIWGSSAADIYIVGENGSVWHRTGSSWKQETTGTKEFLYDVWGSAAGDVYAVGGGGVIIHRTGGSWSSEPSGVTKSMASVWGDSITGVWAGGVSGTLLHRTRGTWTKEKSTSTRVLRDISGSTSSGVWIVTDDGPDMQITAP